MYLLWKNITIHIFLLKCVTKLVGSQAVHPCNLVSDDQKQCFVKDLLLSANHNSNQMAVDQFSDTLYFSFDAGQGEFNPAMLNIETKKLKLLKGVKDAYAIASDNSSGAVYFGGSNGIYKYIPVERKLMRLQYRDLDVYWLFVQKEVFCVQFPRLTAYMYSRKAITPVKKVESSAVHQFVFDDQKNMFFINSSGIFRVREDEDKPVLLKNTSTFLGLAVDNQGKVYTSSDDGIYVIEKSDSKNETEVSRLVSMQGVQSMAFDKNNHLIYSDSHDIVRLLPLQKKLMRDNMELKPNEFRPVNVCHKACEVLQMRNHTQQTTTSNSVDVNMAELFLR